MRSLEERRRLTALALANFTPSLGSRRGRMAARRMTTYGQKDGEGPNTGKKASTYRFTMPDGTVTTKRSFKVDSPVAYALVYQHQGKWYVSAIKAEQVTAERHSTVIATRI
jgi:hypothetical protein